MSEPPLQAAMYDHFGWRLRAASFDRALARLAETHEYFHRQLDDVTSFGGLLATVAALADSSSDEPWGARGRELRRMSDVVHETFAVGMSLLTTQRRLEPLDGYPTYDHYVRVAQRLVGASTTHPWVAMAGVRAAAVTAMQSSVVRLAADRGLAVFEPNQVPVMERPNHRLAVLVRSGFVDAVEQEHSLAVSAYGDETWWRPAGSVTLSPESMDGEAAAAFSRVLRRLMAIAEESISRAGGTTVVWDDHHDDLRRLLADARRLAPGGLTRIGAVVESPGGDLSHGGPLDGQILELTSAPLRAALLPYGTASGGSGEGDARHVFVVLTTPRRLRTAYEPIEGLTVPGGDTIACMRSTVFDADVRTAVLLVAVDGPAQLDESAPVYVCIYSSAAAADAAAASEWMRAADPNRLSLVMDTPATAALRRWCADGAQFRYAARQVTVGDDDLRFIVDRVEQANQRSPLVVIPSTEFGVRWFEAACAEDSELNSFVIEDHDFFDQNGDHLDVLLTHMLLEERFVGTGSWRR